MSDLKTWHDRLEEYITERGDNLSRLENMAGLGPSTLRKAVLNRKSMRSDNFDKIFSVYQELSPSWLFKGEGKKEQSRIAQGSELTCDNNYFKMLEAIQQLKNSEELQGKEEELKLVIEAVDLLIKENDELKSKLIRLYESRNQLVEKVIEKLQ